MDQDLARYNRLIGSYRQAWAKVRALQRRFADREQIFIADKRRDEIHKQLRALALELGKSLQDVDIDILISENNLAEYQLPEFKVLRIANSGLENPSITKLEGDNILEPHHNKRIAVTPPTTLWPKMER